MITWGKFLAGLTTLANHLAAIFRFNQAKTAGRDEARADQAEDTLNTVREMKRHEDNFDRLGNDERDGLYGRWSEPASDGDR